MNSATVGKAIAPHPEGYLRYTTETITPTTALWAEINLNETPENRFQSLKELRSKLKEDNNLIFRDEDRFLLNFLRSRKFNVRGAATMIKKYYSFLEAHRDIFNRTDSEVIQEVVKSNVVGYLPYRDSKGRGIVVVRAEKWKPDEISADDVIFGGIVAMRSSIENPVNQVHGFVAIIDLKNLSLRQILAITPKYLIFATHGLQYCCPCKVSAIHVMNAPPIFKMIWHLIKPLLSEKIKRRFVFHKTNEIESLHKYIPQTLLPTDFGGELGNFDDAHWVGDIEVIQREYYEEIKYGYKHSEKQKRSIPS